LSFSITAICGTITTFTFFAVIEKDNHRFVRVLEKGKIVEKEVKTGISGSNGDIEVISGINPGDKVITFISGK